MIKKKTSFDFFSPPPILFPFPCLFLRFYLFILALSFVCVVLSLQ